MNTNTEKKPVKLFFIIVYALGLILLLGLGGWQVARGLEKQNLQGQVAQKSQSKLLSASPANWIELNYQNAELQGHWLPSKSLLLDNRVYKGRVGYELLNPFRLQDGSVLLVNQGWIEKAKLSDALVSAAKAPLEKVIGQLYLPEKGFTLGEAMSDQHAWPRIIQYYDFLAISNALGEPVQPVIAVTEPAQQSGRIKIWSPYVVNPSRHFGYAFQWWGLAAVFIVFGVIWFRQSTKIVKTA